jgi:hypothetical protein
MSQIAFNESSFNQLAIILPYYGIYSMGENIKKLIILGALVATTSFGSYAQAADGCVTGTSSSGQLIICCPMAGSTGTYYCQPVKAEEAKVTSGGVVTNNPFNVIAQPQSKPPTVKK